MAVRPRWDVAFSADFGVRCLIAGLGVAALAWAIFAMPVFWRQSPIEQMAKRVIAGEPFRAPVLKAVAPALEQLSTSVSQRPSILGAAAQIRLRLLEQALVEGEQAALDERSSALRDTVRKALSQAPADAFLWALLFWLENTREGFDRDRLKYLRMSYATGPSEGWVGIRRNRLAVAIYPQLDAKLAASVADEFGRLVDSQFIAETADILVGPGWPVRDILLPRLENVELVRRQQFAKTVYRLGYDVVVPGVDPRGQRPWD